MAMGNVHGDEESGADAELRVLYELADRTDCAAQQILDNARRRDHPDPEPRRPRGRDAPERLRVRHEPRLVRAHPARDGREARAAAPVPRRALHRRPRDGREPLLLPADGRSDLPRGRRPVDRAGRTTSTARPCSGVRPPAHPVLHDKSSTSSPWCTATSFRRSLQRRRDDVREANFDSIARVHTSSTWRTGCRSRRAR